MAVGIAGKPELVLILKFATSGTYYIRLAPSCYEDNDQQPTVLREGLKEDQHQPFQEKPSKGSSKEIVQ
jgi:hypothetical protein